MTALDAYRGILAELDKDASPSFSVANFNWWFNEAIDEYITENYGSGDVMQKDLDDISVIMMDDVALTQDTDKTLFLKPADYMHLSTMTVIAKALSTYRRWTLNQQETFNIKRQRTARRGFQEDNAYQRPSEDYPMYRVSNEKLKILIGPNFEPVSAKLSYLRKPVTIYLNPDSSTHSNPVNNTPLEFPDYANKEMIRWCARIVLEAIESRRYPTALQEQQLRNE